MESAALIIMEADSGNKFLWIYVLAYNISLYFTKMSILISYRRMFTVTKVKLGAEIMICIVTAIILYTTTSILVQCRPISFYWNRNQDGYCSSPRIIWLSTAALNMATDLVILILPIPVVLKLQLNMRSKISLVFVFTLGAVWVKPSDVCCAHYWIYLGS